MDATHLLESQVGGHAGVRTTEDGSLLIKPALKHELEFYQSLLQNPDLASLRPYTPKFIGTLKLEGVVDPNKPAETEGVVVTPIPGQAEKDKSLHPVYAASRLRLISTVHCARKPFLSISISQHSRHKAWDRLV